MHIRFVQNIRVQLTKIDGTKEQKTLRFGECYAATSIQEIGDRVTVCLKDGDKIEGITAAGVFENYNVPTTKVTPPPPPKISTKSTKPTKSTKSTNSSSLLTQSDKQTKEILLKRHNLNRDEKNEDHDESTS